MKIGSHVSIQGGLLGAAQEAHSYGANTFMIYTGPPQNTRRQALSKMKIEEGHAFIKAHGMEEFLVHAPYLINMASFKEETFALAKTILLSEVSRTQGLGARYLIMHPGSFTERDLDYGIKRIAEGLNEVLSDQTQVTILLETMSGKGTEVGKTFEELKAILDLVKTDMGICLDTCHVHDAGYDLKHDIDSVLQEFDDIIGLSRLQAIHINGSLNPRGARKDRHANLGADESNPKGKDEIGFEAIARIVHHPKLAGKFFILETPWVSEDKNLYAEEIAALKGVR